MPTNFVDTFECQLSSLIICYDWLDLILRDKIQTVSHIVCKFIHVHDDLRWPAGVSIVRYVAAETKQHCCTVPHGAVRHRMPQWTQLLSQKYAKYFTICCSDDFVTLSFKVKIFSKSASIWPSYTGKRVFSPFWLIFNGSVFLCHPITALVTIVLLLRMVATSEDAVPHCTELV